nr:SDR family NAD(P)-dependent oxidoreductase [Enterococcus sp. BWT-B8]
MIENFQNCYPQQDFFVLSLDMLDEQQLPSFFNGLFQVDAIVFAGGFTCYGLLTDPAETEISSLLNIHLKVPILICRKLQNKLSQSGHGRIVFIGSVYGQLGSSMEAVYKLC